MAKSIEPRSQREAKAAELEAEAKRLRRAETSFWEEIDTRKEEVLEHLNVGQKQEDVSDKWNVICEVYKTVTDDDVAMLFEYITSNRQIRYYENNIKPKQTNDINAAYDNEAVSYHSKE